VPSIVVPAKKHSGDGVVDGGSVARRSLKVQIESGQKVDERIQAEAGIALLDLRDHALPLTCPDTQSRLREAKLPPLSPDEVAQLLGGADDICHGWHVPLRGNSSRYFIPEIR
jgi:hypothetical protein